MSLHVIEGTWEEVKRHEAELTGRHVRVIVKPSAPAKNKAATGTIPRRVSAMGKYAGILNSEDFMRSKQEEIDLEDRQR